MNSALAEWNEIIQCLVPTSLCTLALMCEAGSCISCCSVSHAITFIQVTLVKSINTCLWFEGTCTFYNLRYYYEFSCFYVLLQYLVHFLKSLYDWIDRRCTRQTPIASTAWALLCDSYHGNLCLSHQPDVIAVAVLHMTLQCYGVSVPPQEREDTRLHWWQVHLIETVVLQQLKFWF